MTNTNPVTEKQISYINNLRNGETKFLAEQVNTYNNIQNRVGYLPVTVMAKIYVVPSDNHIVIETGAMTPADVIEIKAAFDNYMMTHMPETTIEASAMIDILKGQMNTRESFPFIIDWLTKNYTLTRNENKNYCITK